jgi:hypothetical protein
MQRLRRGQRRGLRPAVGPPASARSRAGSNTRSSPPQLPRPPNRRSPLRCTFDDAGHETSVHSQDQVAPDARRCGHLGPYGLSPISPPREPHAMARGGRCVASLKHSQSPNGCRNPFPQGLRPRTLTTYIAPLTGSLPWRRPHRSLAMGAVAPVVHPPCRRPGPAPRVTSSASRRSHADGPGPLAETSIERRSPSSDRSWGRCLRRARAASEASRAASRVCPRPRSRGPPKPGRGWLRLRCALARGPRLRSHGRRPPGPRRSP